MVATKLWNGMTEVGGRKGCTESEKEKKQGSVFFFRERAEQNETEGERKRADAMERYLKIFS